MTELSLSLAENAIELLAEALGITEQEVVSILREGMESTNQLSKTNKYFIYEMEATFRTY